MSWTGKFQPRFEKCNRKYNIEDIKINVCLLSQLNSTNFPLWDVPPGKFENYNCHKNIGC